MDMNNVKSIYDNSVGKEVKKIQDSNGNIIWYKVPDGYRKVKYLESSNGRSDNKPGMYDLVNDVCSGDFTWGEI